MRSDRQAEHAEGASPPLVPSRRLDRVNASKPSAQSSAQPAQSNAAPGSEASGPAATGEVTRLLAESANGRISAFDEIIPLVYEDLRRLAHKRLRSERADHTLNTTAVVHEAYLHLVDQAEAGWKDRSHFFAVASRVIRNVLVDYAREQGAAKRGGGVVKIPLREELEGRESRLVDLLALDEALTRLAQHEQRLERIVECRFFGGMTVKEAAEALGTSVRTVERDWTRAKAYLYQELWDGGTETPPPEA